jgi:hypothetical protein
MLLLLGMRCFLFLTWALVVASSENDILSLNNFENNEAISFAFQSDEELMACWELLNDSDPDGNGKVESDEYVTFAKGMSRPGLLDGVTFFNQLPLAFIAAFQFNACLCRQPAFGGNSSQTECCYGDRAHIRVTDPPNANISDEDKVYLVASCSFTEAAAVSVEVSFQPTPAPTIITEAPTPVGSPAPSLSPAPTPSPTSSPTETPTRREDKAVKSEVEYQIIVDQGNTNGKLDPDFILSYTLDLIRAMNRLAPKVAEEVFGSINRRLGQRRRLSVMVKLPTFLALSNIGKSIQRQWIKVEPRIV